LSVDADHESVIAVWVAPLAARPAGVVGADVSEHALVLVVPVASAGSDALPAASNAAIATVYDVPHASPTNK
jgi:hypothetical protein